ncbi:hypothetical protein ACXM1Q_004835 [Streptococcus sp. 10F2]
MIYFVSIRTIVNTILLLLAGIGVYILFKTIGLSMFFLLIVGLLALKFVPALVLPIILLSIGVHFTGGFSFIADLIVGIFWFIVVVIVWGEYRYRKK